MKHLRELAKDFAQGNLNKDEYRKLRGDLIQGIVAGDIPVPDREFLAPLSPSEDADITAQGYEYDPGSTTQIVATQPGKKKSSTPRPQSTSSTTPVKSPSPFSVPLFIGLSIGVLLLIAGITAIFIYSSDRPATTTENAATETTSQPVAGQAAETLIRLFLQQNDWRQENLDKFVSNWQKIGPHEQQAAADLPIKNQIKNAIYKQIIEQRALIALGDAESARANQQRLVEFAAAIGIQDPSISVDP